MGYTRPHAKWCVQQDRRIAAEFTLNTRDKARMAGFNVTRKFVVLVIGAAPDRAYQFAYRNSNLVKRVVWWAQS
jgi:hypothetical protein